MLVISLNLLLRFVTLFILFVWWLYWAITEKKADVQIPKTKKEGSVVKQAFIRRMILRIVEGVMVLQVFGISLLPFYNAIIQIIGFFLVLIGFSIALSARKTLGSNWAHSYEYQVKKQQLLVLIKNLQMNYATRSVLHVDFYQVNLKEKVKANIPIVFTGEAVAVTDKIGLLLQNLSEVEVEALPDNLPENIEVSVEQLAQIGDQITVASLKVSSDVVILTDPSQVIAKIAEPTAEEPEPETPAEGEEAVEGEQAAKTEEGSEETKDGESTDSNNAPEETKE